MHHGSFVFFEYLSGIRGCPEREKERESERVMEHKIRVRFLLENSRHELAANCVKAAKEMKYFGMLSIYANEGLNIMLLEALPKEKKKKKKVQWYMRTFGSGAG